MFLQSPFALFLLALPLGAALLFLVKRRKPGGRRVVPLSPPKDVIQKHVRKTRFRFRMLFAGLLLSFCGLVWVIAQPAKNLVWTKKWAESIDIMIALDVSESMDATDFEPDRLIVAKRVIRDFIERRPNDRIGLIVFGGEAITTSPLTRDYDFLLTQLDNAKTRELKQGTAIGMALANGVARFQRSQNKTRVIILITDGDNNVGAINPITAANLAKDDNIRIYSIGIGKSNRVIVPIYAQDSFGRKTHLIAKVPSYLNPELLEKISKITGGKSYMATNPDSLKNVLAEIDSLERTRVQVSPITKKEELFFPVALITTFFLFLIITLLETRFRRSTQTHAVAT